MRFQGGACYLYVTKKNNSFFVAYKVYYQNRDASTNSQNGLSKMLYDLLEQTLA